MSRRPRGARHGRRHDRGLPLGFAQPLVLLGLLSLPMLWWLLRLIPPRPRRVEFPPTRLLFDIAPKEETPARTPWWLTLLRLTLAALVIIAAAGPLWNPPVATSSGAAPLALLIDDGWAAAASWDARMRTADDIIARAEADNRGVALVPLSEAGARHLARDAGRRARAPQAAQAEAACGRPQSRRCRRSRVCSPPTPDVEIMWLSDGVDLGRGVGVRRRRSRGSSRAGRSRWSTGGMPTAHALAAADNAAGALTRQGAARGTTGGAETARARARSQGPAARRSAALPSRPDERETDAEIDLPVEIRNDIARLEIVAERSAGAVQLLDKRWRRRTVGVVSGATAETAQPLLASTYYLVARARAVRRCAPRRARVAGARRSSASSTRICRC